MPAKLSLGTELDAVTNTTASATGWADVVEALLRAALADATNPFGTAATLDAGDGAGQLPIIGADGRLADALLPAIRAMQRITLTEYAPGLPIDSDRVQTVRYLWQSLRRAARPGTTVLDGDLAAIGGGRQVQVAGTTFPLAHPWADYRQIEVRYSRGGVVQPNVTIDVADGFPVTEVEESGGSTLTVQAAAGVDSSRQVTFTRGGPSAYRIIAVAGVNPVTGLADRAWVAAELAASIGQGVSQRLARATLTLPATNVLAALTPTAAQFGETFTFIIDPDDQAPPVFDASQPDRSITLTLPAGAAGLFAVRNDTEVLAVVQATTAIQSPQRVTLGRSTNDGLRHLLFVDGDHVTRAVAEGDTATRGLLRLSTQLLAGDGGRAADAAAVRGQLDRKANLASPAFTGSPTAPTPPRPAG